MTGEKLRKQAYDHICAHPYLWRKWVEAREEWQRQELMLEVTAGLVADFCIAEMYANQDDILFVVDRIRREYEPD